MFYFINKLKNRINKIKKNIEQIDIGETNLEQILNKFCIDNNCFEFIKSKSKEILDAYFDLAKVHVNNLKYFIQIELDHYYKNYNQIDYDKFKSFQKFQLENLTQYELEEKSNENFREEKQNEYINEIYEYFKTGNKVFIKAPTGFGKTVLYYKAISKLKLKKILILTPRISLNEQIVENKYLDHILFIFTLSHSSSEALPDFLSYNLFYPLNLFMTSPMGVEILNWSGYGTIFLYHPISNALVKAAIGSFGFYH